MKQDKDKLSQLGFKLSNQLGKAPFKMGCCLSPEEIAALVDNRVTDVGEKDRMMTHLASCGECYEVYNLTVQLSEENVTDGAKPIRLYGRKSFFRPLALAASLLIVVTSVYVLWKRGDLPRSSQDLVEFSETVSTTATETAPPAPQMMEEKVQPMMETPEPHRSVTEEPESSVAKSSAKHFKKQKSFLTEKKKAVAPAKPKGLKDSFDASVVDEEDKSVEKDQSLDMKSSVASVEVKGDAVDQKLRKPVRLKKTEIEENEGVKLAEVLPVAKPLTEGEKGSKNEQFVDDGVQLGKQTRAPKPNAVVDQPHAKGRGIEQRLMVSEHSTPMARLNHLNFFAANSTGYLEATQLQSLFSQALALADELKKDRNLVRRQLHPLLKTFASGDDIFIYPDMNYFLIKSAPGSIENRFFALAQNYWCDSQGNCYSRGDTGKTEKWAKVSLEKRSDLNKAKSSPLQQWQQLQPQLKGIFKKIAENTISHLEKNRN